METIHDKIKNNEPINKGDIVRALNKIKEDISIVRNDLEEKNPKVMDHLDEITEKIERTLLDETFSAVKRGKTLLDTNLHVHRTEMELGQQHQDIVEMKKKIDEVDNVDKKICGLLNSIAERSGNLLGISNGKKIEKKVRTKQSKMLEIIDLDSSLRPQEQKILRYLIIDKYTYQEDKFSPAFSNEIVRNSGIRKGEEKKIFNSLMVKGLIESKKDKNKIYYSISPKFFGAEAHSVEHSIEEMAG